MKHKIKSLTSIAKEPRRALCYQRQRESGQTAWKASRCVGNLQEALYKPPGPDPFNHCVTQINWKCHAPLIRLQSSQGTVRIRQERPLPSRLWWRWCSSSTAPQWLCDAAKVQGGGRRWFICCVRCKRKMQWKILVIRVRWSCLPQKEYLLRASSSSCIIDCIRSSNLWFWATSRRSASCNKPSRLWIRSLRANSLRSAMPASFFNAEFWSTNCFCTMVSCSRLRSRNTIFFCCALLLLLRITLLYCSLISSSWISSSTTFWGKVIFSRPWEELIDHFETDLLATVLQVTH